MNTTVGDEATCCSQCILPPVGRLYPDAALRSLPRRRELLRDARSRDRSLDGSEVPSPGATSVPSDSTRKATRWKNSLPNSERRLSASNSTFDVRLTRAVLSTPLWRISSTRFLCCELAQGSQGRQRCRILGCESWTKSRRLPRRGSDDGTHDSRRVMRGVAGAICRRYSPVRASGTAGAASPRRVASTSPPRNVAKGRMSCRTLAAASAAM